MTEFEYLPRSNVGNTINCIYLERALVERIYTKPRVYNSLKCSINESLVEWVFLVGIYQSKDKFYLSLESNDYSFEANQMIEDDTFPNTGFMEISESTALEISEKISQLGKEFFEISIPNFHILMALIVSTMGCEVSFDTLLDENGHFDKANNRIVVANNISQFCMMWTLFHEYVHFLRKSEEKKPDTFEEYWTNKEEYLCNAVAFELMKIFFDKDLVISIVESALFKIKNDVLRVSDLNTLKEGDFRNLFSPEEYSIISFCSMLSINKSNEETQSTVDSIVAQILESIEFKTDKEFEIDINCEQTGLVKLSPVDNQKLYDIIINVISPMMPTLED